MMLIEKPWGSEEILDKNDNYVVKRLYMKAGHQCSLQFHNEKREMFYVLSGVMKFTIGDENGDLQKIILMPGQFYLIEPKRVHRMEAIQDCFYLETSTNHLDDVVRLQDSYGRT